MPLTAYGSPMEEQACGTCGGDRKIGNSFGSLATCPSCHGTGRRFEDTGFRDVTKTKASHHGPTNVAKVVEKTKWPVTFEGGQLGNEVQACASVTTAVKAKLIQEIIDHEGTHGSCTQTFIKKVRKQVRARVSL